MPLTDEEAAVQAITSLVALTDIQRESKTKIDEMLDSDEPFIDIHLLFAQFDILYFRTLLCSRVEVSWSHRLTLCAGICELMRDPNNGDKFTRIRLKLSEPLLKYRPRNDVVNTLLHESIHAYFFVTSSWQHSRGDDGTGHGPGFLLLADAINDHGGYDVTVGHTFHDEVDSYRIHIWQCDGSCATRPPFFGLVKRSMNRAPGRSDSWWRRHHETCGGVFTKIAGPTPTGSKAGKQSGSESGGRQKNKITSWLARDVQKEGEPCESTELVPMNEDTFLGADAEKTDVRGAKPSGDEASGDYPSC